MSLRAEIGLWGIHHKYQFQEDKKVLRKGGRGFYEASYSFQLKFNYRIRNSWGFDLMLHRGEYDIGMYDKHYFDTRGVDRRQAADSTNGKQELEGYTGAYKNYYGAGVAVHKYFNVKNFPNKQLDERLYFSLGVLYNQIENTDVYTCKYHDKARLEVLTLTAKFKPVVTQTFAEFGFNYSDLNWDFYIGLRYARSDAHFVQAQYEHVDQNRTIIARDEVKVWPNYYSICIGVGPKLKTFKSKFGVPKSNQVEKTIVKMEAPELDANDTLKEGFVADSNAKVTGTYKDRAVVRAHHLYTKTDSVSIQIWDKGVVDGDRISLYLNGSLIYEDIELTATKKILSFNLLPGNNELIMYVEDEGSIKPCTAALIVTTENGKQVLNLSSSASSSGSIMIQYNP